MAVFLRIRTICFTCLSFKIIRNIKSCEQPKSCEGMLCEQLFGNSEPLKKQGEQEKYSCSPTPL
jgi:hypothetical protein